MLHTNPVALYLFTLANLAITAGYIFIAFAIVPRIRVKLLRTKIGGVGFFISCGLTHLDQALHALFFDDETLGHMATSWHMMLIHVPQAIFVWLFVTGLYIELVKWGPWATDAPGTEKTTPVQEIMRDASADS